MNAGLVRQALRRHPGSFLGAMTTQTLAAALISGSLGVLASVDRAPLTASARQALVETAVPDMAVVFVLISVYLSILIVGVTMGAAIGRQARDFALVRAIGATPGRVRRAVAAQAAVVAVPSALIGVLVGTWGGHAWLSGLVSHGVVPPEVTFRASPIAVPVALAVTVVTSAVGALIAAIRPSRVRPAIALTESVAPLRASAARTVTGLALLVGGLVSSALIASRAPEQAEDASIITMLAMCVGAGLTSPALLRVVALAVRRLGSAGALAADTIVVRAKAYSGAMVPLVLAAAFATVKVVMHTTAARHGVTEPAADRWTDYSGTAVYTAFAAIAALTALATVVLSRRRDLAVVRLAGATSGRVQAVLICEAGIVIVTGLTAASVVAAATALPMLHAAFGTWLPWLPPGTVLAGVLGVTAVVVAGTVIPGAIAMRRPAIEAVEVDA